MTAAVIRLNFQPNPDPATLIADFGHPRWPGWWLIMIGLIITQIFILFQPGDMTQLRPRPPGPGFSRVNRAPTARTGRSGRQTKTAGG